jgi:hypothetical protein
MIELFLIVYAIDGALITFLTWREYRLTPARTLLWFIAWPVMMWRVSKGKNP